MYVYNKKQQEHTHDDVFVVRAPDRLCTRAYTKRSYSNSTTRFLTDNEENNQRAAQHLLAQKIRLGTLGIEGRLQTVKRLRYLALVCAYTLLSMWKSSRPEKSERKSFD